MFPEVIGIGMDPQAPFRREIDPHREHGTQNRKLDLKKQDCLIAGSAGRGHRPSDTELSLLCVTDGDIGF